MYVYMSPYAMEQVLVRHHGMHCCLEMLLTGYMSIGYVVQKLLNNHT